MNLRYLTIIALQLLFFLSLSPGSTFADEPQYEVVPDQYIIRFRDELSREDVLRLTRNLTAQQKLKLRHTYLDSIKGFSATVPAHALEILRQHADILTIEPNGVWYLEGDGPSIETVDAPTNLAATPQGQTAILLTWTENATSEQGYQVVRSTTGVDGDYTVLFQAAGVDVTSFTDNNVVADQEYCYKVLVAESATVIGEFSAPACATIVPPPPPPPPAAPIGMAATTINDQRIDLSWVDQSDNETGFRIERSLGAGGTFTEIDLVGANVTTYSDTGLSGNTEYCYRARAYNATGDSAYTNVSCATTDPVVIPPDPLAAPSDLAAEPIGETQIVLTWVDNAT